MTAVGGKDSCRNRLSFSIFHFPCPEIAHCASGIDRSDPQAMTNAKSQMENDMGNASAPNLDSQSDHEDRFDAGDLADVGDYRTDIGVMIRRRFDRNRSLLHLELPGHGLGVLFQQAAYLLLKVSVAAAEGPGNCAA